MNGNIVQTIMSGIENKAKESVQPSADDYIEDGLLHCGKCRTPKQCVVTLFGEIRTPYCLCVCETERREREEEESKRQAFIARVAKLRRNGFPESRMQDWNFENDDMSNERVTTAMKRYVENFEQFCAEGKGLILHGSVGGGKTYAACEVANALIDMGIPVLVTNFARLTNTIQGMYEGKQEYIDSLSRYALLVIDDLGAERTSEFMQEMVFNIIDSRYRAGLPMIITTNLAMEEMRNPKTIGAGRIYDRIVERCFPIEVKRESRRRNMARDNYMDMKNILGL